MDKEIQNRASFEILRYANCWEDPQVLLEALNINESTCCLSIASAGDNSLALLTKSPAMIVAIDISSAQLACLELKKIAMAELGYADYLIFLGYDMQDNHREQIYKRLEKYLSHESRDFFTRNNKLISKGLIHQGKFERYFHIFHNYFLPIVHSQKSVEELLKEKTQQERLDFYSQHWNTIGWKILFRMIFNRFVMGRLGRDPEFFKYVDDLIISQHIFKRVEYALTTLSTDNNPYLKYILTGHYGDTLPFYLRRENYERIRDNIDKLKIYKSSLSEFLSTSKINFDAFNLSDIFEYIDKERFYNISNDIIKHSNKNARLVYWNMLVHRQLSDLRPDRVTYLKDLSTKLFKVDQAFFYKSLYVEEVI